MDPNHRGPEDQEEPAGQERQDGVSGAASGGASGAVSDGRDSGALARTVQLVAGEYLLTINPVDGSEIEPCPPGQAPGVPHRHSAEARAELQRATTPVPSPPAGGTAATPPLLEREEERGRLARLLARGRSVRLSGPSGSGRTRLLDAVAADCATLAPDGVVRLSGYHRTPTDLLHELFAAVYDAPLRRPERDELLEAVRGIGAVVVLDDIEFGGVALDELRNATPECAFLISATPDIPAPSADSDIEEVFLSGISRTGCLELLELTVRRPLSDDEADWAADLWFESEGLPLRFVQAGALLRQRDARPDEALPELTVGSITAGQLAAGLSPRAKETLRFGIALGGELPHQAHLPALVDDAQADTAIAELATTGLATAAGPHHRLTAGTAVQLAAEGYGEDAAVRARTAAQHYTWWAGHASVTPAQVAAEADTVLAAVQGAQRGGHPSAAVLLAHTAAPVLATALHWSAWERTLRSGQEAARLAGEVAEEAYFHHELGVLALCTGNLDRARAELEASIGLRGVLADRRGAVAGRRALALVTDLSAAQAAPKTAPTAPSSGASDTTLTSPYEPQPAPSPAGAGSDGATVDYGAYAFGFDKSASSAHTDPGSPPAARRLAITGARRNVVAGVAGVLLAAVLGTVVTLGNASSDEDDPSDSVRPDRSSSQQDQDDGLPADRPSAAEPSGETPRTPGPSSAPGTVGSPTPSASDDAPSASPSDSDSPSGGTSDGGSDGGSSSGGSSSGGSSGGSGDGGGTGGSSGSGGSSSSGGGSGGPSDDPSDPSDDPSDPSDDPSDPSDDPSDGSGGGSGGGDGGGDDSGPPSNSASGTPSGASFQFTSESPSVT